MKIPVESKKSARSAEQTLSRQAGEDYSHSRDGNVPSKFRILSRCCIGIERHSGRATFLIFLRMRPPKLAGSGAYSVDGVMFWTNLQVAFRHTGFRTPANMSLRSSWAVAPFQISSNDVAFRSPIVP